MRGPKLENNTYRSWQDFTQQQFRRANTFQLCIEELENDLFFDEMVDKKDDEELNFDY